MSKFVCMLGVMLSVWRPLLLIQWRPINDNISHTNVSDCIPTPPHTIIERPSGPTFPVYLPYTVAVVALALVIIFTVCVILVVRACLPHHTGELFRRMSVNRT